MKVTLVLLAVLDINTLGEGLSFNIWIYCAWYLSGSLFFFLPLSPLFSSRGFLMTRDTYNLMMRVSYKDEYSERERGEASKT